MRCATPFRTLTLLVSVAALLAGCAGVVDICPKGLERSRYSPIQ